MFLLSRLLRLGIGAMSLVILAGIVPISLLHYQTGSACPVVWSVPMCYVVSICYAAIGISAFWFGKPMGWLFVAGIVPVLLLALTGTSLELLGNETCPRSDTGWPLCYTSLMVGLSLALAFGLVFWSERQDRP